ncbi:MAG: valine--tRNA ligase [Firmicutes bacterium]|nr:valine--tRNA ligase [Bacillota bacterium]
MTEPTAAAPRSAGIPKVYNPADVESKWYRYWEERGLFHVEPDQEGTAFSVVIPPPNVTGSLHMGHALNNTLQDVIVRWRRMQGFLTLWVPGTDHAGIATQHVVEEELAKEGQNRWELGRDKFVERVWSWKERYGHIITDQLRRLGASCDWQRERFTMDEGLSRAVRQVFVDLYDRGLIYQGNYIVNWCPSCGTTLSDIEVEHEEQDGKLYHIRYPLVDGGEHITVATTRPETMLGDTAVAVHPGDARYRHLVGRKVRLPLMNREIPIVADEWANPEFGTGAVKVTPAHDPNDFEIGERHGLSRIQVIGADARMTTEAGPYAGLDRYECRKAVVRDLEAQGFLVKVEEHRHAVGRCYRCDTVVEPLVSRQWFVRMKPLAQPAIEAVRDGRVKFVPERFAKNYLHWMENIRDWCISRQLWWGHRIPVWTCGDCGHMFAAVEDPDRCPKCESSRLEQDPDVLDTWFSSALWPFSTLGWPGDTADLRRFYPTSVLVTGFDIIYFWVARMIFMGLHFMGREPFRHVLIHGLVRDALGRKMSKSLGNGVDPLEVIREYGADALRFTLVTGIAPGNDTRYQPEKVEASRNFCNKIWNASRFAMMNLEDFDPGEAPLENRALELHDRWILSRLEWTAGEVTRHLERFDLGEAARTLYDFVWGELCDWYIELIKPRLYGREGEESRRAAQHTLFFVLESTLRLLHPYIPFLTEEVWQLLHDVTGAARPVESIMVAPWPAPSGWRNPAAEEQMADLIDIVRAIRNVRAEKQVEPGRFITAILQAAQDKHDSLRQLAPSIQALARVGELLIRDADASPPERAVAAIAGGVRVYLPLAGLVDVERERARIEAELAETARQLQAVAARLANEGFVRKAPAAVVERERRRREELAEKEQLLRQRLAELE